MVVQVGADAPGFSIEGTDGTDGGRRIYSLGEYLGDPVVLVFYPADASPVCTRQLNTYSSEIGQFAELGAHVLALSPQSIESHASFAAEQGGFAFPLLADVDKAVGEAYGVLGPVGFYRRCVFVIDREAVVRYAHRSVAGLTFRPTSEIVDALRRLDD